MTSIVQKILVDSDHHKLRMQEKDVAGIVKFGPIGLLLPTHIITYITMAYQSLRGNGQY